MIKKNFFQQNNEESVQEENVYKVQEIPFTQAEQKRFKNNKLFRENDITAESMLM